MSFSHIARVNGHTSGQNCPASSSLNVASGDLLVGLVVCSGGDPGVFSVDDGSGGNVFTILSKTGSGDSTIYMALCYKIGAAANAALTPTMHITGVNNNIELIVAQYSPSAGLVFDAGPFPHTAGSGEWESGTLTTTGLDELVVAGGIDAAAGYIDPGTPKIAAGAPDHITVAVRSLLWEKAFSSIQTSIVGDVENWTGQWIADIMSFKIGGGGGGGGAGIYFRLRKQYHLDDFDRAFKVYHSLPWKFREEPWMRHRAA